MLPLGHLLQLGASWLTGVHPRGHFRQSLSDSNGDARYFPGPQPSQTPAKLSLQELTYLPDPHDLHVRAVQSVFVVGVQAEFS